MLASLHDSTYCYCIRTQTQQWGQFIVSCNKKSPGRIAPILVNSVIHCFVIISNPGSFHPSLYCSQHACSVPLLTQDNCGRLSHNNIQQKTENFSLCHTFWGSQWGNLSQKLPQRPLPHPMGHDWGTGLFHNLSLAREPCSLWQS